MEWNPKRKKKSCTFHKNIMLQAFCNKVRSYLITSLFACYNWCTHKKKLLNRKKKQSQHMYAFWFKIVRTFTLWIIYIFFLLTFCGSLGCCFCRWFSKWCWNVSHFIIIFSFLIRFFFLYRVNTSQFNRFSSNSHYSITPAICNENGEKKKVYKFQIFQFSLINLAEIWSSHMRKIFQFQSKLPQSQQSHSKLLR